MNRRWLLMMVWAACLGAASIPASGQQAGTYRIGYLSPEAEASGRAMFDAFRGGLRDLGYVEGRNVMIDARWSNGSDDLLDRQADELSKLNPNLFVTQTRAVLAVRKLGGATPVVFAFSGDPVLAKLVDSLARPGGRFTGLSMLSLDLTAKRMALLKELLPDLKRVAIITNPGHPGEEAERRVSIASARALGLSMEYFPVRNAAELESALARIPGMNCGAVMVFPDAGTITYSSRIAEFTQKTRIPAMSGWVVFAEEGNLVTYGPELRDAFRRLASYADKILKGASPASLPVELPTKFELAINLKTARMLGIKVPPGILARVDRIVE